MEIGVNMNKEKNGSILPIMAMDSISDAGPDALKITGLVKSGGTVTGYQLSDGRIVSRESGVELAKENKIVINREISDALYKAMDLLSDLIQESVKLKKEYYTDDIQKIIDYIDELTEKYQGQSVEESKNITQNEQNKEITTNPKTQNQDFLKTTITINALLSEAYLLLKNMQGEEGSSYIETFCDVIKQLDEKFEETNFYEIKNEIKNIFAKVDFVIKSSNLMTDDEIKDIDNKLTNTVNFLNKIYEYNKTKTTPKTSKTKIKLLHTVIL